MKNYEELSSILGNLKNRGNLEGIIFSFRDGKLIAENNDIELNKDNFISMCASVLESAVGIGETVGNQKINRVIAELKEKTVILLECDDKTFLILIIKVESQISEVFSRLDDIIQKIITLY
ncbi:MAG: hypothetical protein ACFE9Z_00930 [Promethearchaeota archaeon]